MIPETTKEFGFRLRQATEAHPSAPPNDHGRLSWLKRELETHTETSVSVNTVHKWMKGLARPREDKIRSLARVLRVDELWLAMGRKPVDTSAITDLKATKANGAVLLLAGLMELRGHRVIFSDEDDTGAQLLTNTAYGRQGIVAVTPQGETPDAFSFIIPEPVGESRVIAVIPEEIRKSNSWVFTLIDMTKVKRQSMGGFALAQIQRNTEGGFSADGISVPVFDSLDLLAETT